jgi:hypothetical protein
MANRSIVTCAQDMSTSQVAPSQTISVGRLSTQHGANITVAEARLLDPPLLLLPFQLHIRFANSSFPWYARVSRPVEHINISADSLSSDKVGVLWHITSTVDLILVIDPLDDSHTGGGRRIVISEF